MWTAVITFTAFFVDVLYVGVGSVKKSFLEKMKTNKYTRQEDDFVNSSRISLVSVWRYNVELCYIAFV